MLNATQISSGELAAQATSLAERAGLSLRQLALKLLSDPEGSLSERSQFFLDRALSRKPLDIGISQQDLADFTSAKHAGSGAVFDECYVTERGDSIPVDFDCAGFRREVLAPKISEYVGLNKGMLTEIDWDGLVNLAKGVVSTGSLEWGLLSEGKGLHELFAFSLLQEFMAHPAFLKSARAAEVVAVLCDGEEPITKAVFGGIRYDEPVHRGSSERRLRSGFTVDVLCGVQAILKNDRVRRCWAYEIKTEYVALGLGEVVRLLTTTRGDDLRTVTLPARIALAEFSLLWSEQNGSIEEVDPSVMQEFELPDELVAFTDAGMELLQCPQMGRSVRWAQSSFPRSTGDDSP